MVGTAQECCLWRSHVGEVWPESGRGSAAFRGQGWEQGCCWWGVRLGPCMGSGLRPSVVPGGRAKLWTWCGFTQASCLDRDRRKRLFESKNHSIMGWALAQASGGSNGHTWVRAGECSPRAGAVAHPLGHRSSGWSLLRVTGVAAGNAEKVARKGGKGHLLRIYRCQNCFPRAFSSNSQGNGQDRYYCDQGWGLPCWPSG